MKLRLPSSAVSVLLAAFAGGAVVLTANDVTVSKQVTAAEIGAVTVMPFEGSKGAAFADLISHELLARGAKLIDRVSLAAILRERSVTIDDLANGRADLSVVRDVGHVDTVVFGSVTPITVYISGAESGRVSVASFRLVQTESGNVLSSVAFNSNTELLARGKTYATAASMMVAQLIRK